jgi:hypothetical protein
MPFAAVFPRVFWTASTKGEGMQRYEVVTHDDEQVVGHVVDKVGSNYIVELGHLRKTKHALPEQLGWLDEGGERLLISVSEELLHGSPRVEGEVDEQAVAAHYGLVDTTVDDPAGFDDSEVIEERIETLERLEPTGGIRESPALLGDHFEDTYLERERED